VREIDLSIKP